MVNQQKFSAKHVFWDKTRRVVIDKFEIEAYREKRRLSLPENIIRFDSQHEFKVYLELCRMYQEYRIQRQYPIEIIKPGWCYPRGKTWKVDFAVGSRENPETPEVYVEAKGMVTSDFTFILPLVEELAEDIFYRLVIVFPSVIPTQNKVIKSLKSSPMGDSIIKFEQLKKMDSLQ